MSFHVPNKYRLKKHYDLASDDSYGNNGFFTIPHYRIADYFFGVQASDGEGWEHASISLFTKKGTVKRCPIWEEMCYIKDIFWDKTDTVIQYHPAEKDYVNMHPFVLHLWRPINIELPLPDSLLVGIKDAEIIKKDK
jgi:hypothetical protein